MSIMHRHGSARSDRESSSISLGVEPRPAVVVTTIGKNEIRNVIAIRGKSCTPRMTMMMGATATIGIEWIATTIGKTAREKVSEETKRIASGIDTTTATANPA